jgi:hypothetical protein
MRAVSAFFSRPVLSTLTAMMCLLPFGVLSWYSHPALDDFAIGHHLQSRSMVHYVADVYCHSSGRYASSLCSVVLKFFGAHPFSYKYLILVNLVSFVLSLYIVAASLVRGMASANSLTWALGSLLTVAALVNYPWPAEGIFWLTGSIAYLYPVALTGLLTALLGYLYAEPTRPHRLLWAGSILLGFLIPGFSEITALLLPLVYVGVWGALQAPAMRLGWWVVGGAILLGSLLTLASPAHFGQWHTLGQAHGLAHLAQGVVLATEATTYLAVNWLGNGLLPLLALLALPLVPQLARVASQRFLLHRLAQRPWLWPVLTVAGVWLVCVFCYMATGQGPALRVKNFLYLYFMMGGLLSAYAYARRLESQYVALLVARPVQTLLAGWAVVAVLSDYNIHLTHDNIGRGSTTLVQAYRDWLSGSAAAYDRQQQARYVKLRRGALPGGIVRLDPLQVLPPTLFYYDISRDEHLWGNQAYAQFFGVPAVYVAPAAAARGVGQ